MYHNVYFQGVKRRPVNQQQNNGYAENPFKRTDYKQFNEISPAVNSAIYAYASPIIRKPYEKMDLYECISTLKREGRIEGVDFETDRSRLIHIKNKQGEVIKCLGYKDPNDRNPFVQNIIYDSKNRRIKTIHKENNQVKFYDDIYYNNEVPQEQFTSAHLTNQTTPEEYINYLRVNNKNFKIENEKGENFDSTEITELDSGGKKKNIFRYMKFNDGYEQTSLKEFNKEEEFIKEISFTPHTTTVTTYLEKSKTNFIPQEILKPEDLTKEHITAFTKPEEYVQYLKENGIKYKFEPKDYGEQKIVGITEYDRNNRETQFTGFELSGEPSVRREIFEQNGNRIRYEFQPEGTYVTTFRY